MAEKKEKQSEENIDCFVIMPISDSDGYEKGHFKHVYDDILAPACKQSGYKPVRADDVLQTSMIHLDILKKLVESPMAICDLSSRNPNVLFELGLRQAFDKPVVLVQEIGTEKIFDIAPLKYTEYRKALKYHEVLADQEAIALAIQATRDSSSKGEGINSIVKLLSLTNPASLKEVSANKNDLLLQFVRAEMQELRSEFRFMIREVARDSEIHRRHSTQHFKTNEFGHRFVQIRELLSRAASLAEKATDIATISEAFDMLNKSQRMCMSLMDICTTNSEREKIHELLNESNKLEKRIVVEINTYENNKKGKSE